MTRTREFCRVALFISCVACVSVATAEDRAGALEPLASVPSYDQVRDARTLRLPNIRLDAATTVELNLTRFEVFAPGARIVAASDLGETELPLPPVALFRGQVSGDAGSLAFLSVSPDATYGYVLIGGRKHVLSSGPAGSGLATLAVDLASLPAPLADAPQPTCHSDDLPIVAPQPPTGGAPRGSAPCRTARLALDTDFEYTADLFGGNTTSASAYAATLIGGVSAIYMRDVNVRMEIGYLRLWTTPTDPWDQSNTTNQLFQFRDHWVANMTEIPRHLAHYLSGRGLGGGVAWLSVVCDPDFGFGLSANLGGSFPYPIQNNHGANWDLMVVAHELGHNFGAPHTHDLAPPVDGCASGDCSVVPNGTIMSYCHLCSGGLANVRMEFHPRNINENMLPHLDSVCSLTGSPFDGHSLSFDGLNNVVTVPGLGGVIPASEVTIEFWQYAVGEGNRSTFGLSTDSLTNRFQAHVPWSDGRVYFDFGNINTGGRLNYLPPVSIVGSWQHFALVASQSGNTMRIYRNGVLESSKVGMDAFAPNAAWSLQLGAVGGTNRFRGRLDEVRIWSRARSAAEIAASWSQTLDPAAQTGLLAYWKFEEGSGTTAADSAADHDGTVSGATWYLEDDCINDTGACCFPDGSCLTLTQAACADLGGSYQGAGSNCGAGCPSPGACCLPDNQGVCIVLFEVDCVTAGGTFLGEGATCAGVGPFDGFALQFDGTNDYVNVAGYGGVAPTNEVTIEFWQLTDDVASRSTFGMSVDQVGNRFQAHVPWSDGRIYWDLGNINTGGRLSYLPPVALAGSWQHFSLVASQSGNMMRIYRNGVLEAQKAGMSPFVRNAAWSLRLGAVAGTNFFRGKLDEVRIWNHARSAAEIAATYNVSLDPAAQTGLVGYWRMNEGLGPTTADASPSGRTGTLTNGVAWAATATCANPCPGDVNGSGSVDLNDLSQLLAHFGMSGGATLADGDLDGDQDVDLSDLAELLANFGSVCP